MRLFAERVLPDLGLWNLAEGRVLRAEPRGDRYVFRDLRERSNVLIQSTFGTCMDNERDDEEYACPHQTTESASRLRFAEFEHTGEKKKN